MRLLDSFALELYFGIKLPVASIVLACQFRFE
jgi:hypothetical protein